MMHFMLLFSRQGKVRLQKWYTSYSEREKKKILRDLMAIVLSRRPRMCSFVEWKNLKIVYRRYASLYFCTAIEPQDNELLTLEIIHRYVELLDKYFGSMHFMLLFSRQGKVRLQKWYTSYSEREKKKILRDLMAIVLSRRPRMCSFVEWKDLKIVYRRYASLYFCTAIEPQDNELLTLEIIHRYVELLDKYFGSVCELDIIFHFEKAYYVLDEFLLGGEVQETGKDSALNDIDMQDLLQEEECKTREEHADISVIDVSEF